MSRPSPSACEGPLSALRLLFLFMFVLCPGLLRAEVAELLAARQYGLSYLPLMVMESEKLVEKHAAQNGLGNLSVSWKTFANGPAMNDAIISGNLHFAS